MDPDRSTPEACIKSFREYRKCVPETETISFRSRTLKRDQLGDGPIHDHTAKSMEFKVNDKVLIPTMGINGTVRFIGQTKFKEGLWAGVEIDEKFGKNDGSINGISYFSCAPNCGIFIHPARLELLERNGSSLLRPSGSSSSLMPPKAGSRDSLNGRNTDLRPTSMLKPPSTPSLDQTTSIPPPRFSLGMPRKPAAPSSVSKPPQPLGASSLPTTLSKSQSRLSSIQKPPLFGNETASSSVPKSRMIPPTSSGSHTLTQTALEAAQRKRSQPDTRRTSSAGSDALRSPVSPTRPAALPDLEHHLHIIEKQRADMDVLASQNNLLTLELTQAKSQADTMQTQVGMLHAQLLDTQFERDEVIKQVNWMKHEMNGLMDQMAILHDDLERRKDAAVIKSDVHEVDSVEKVEQADLKWAKQVDGYCVETQVDLKALESNLSTCLEVVDSESQQLAFFQTKAQHLEQINVELVKDHETKLASVVASYESKIKDILSSSGSSFENVSKMATDHEARMKKLSAEHEAVLSRLSAEYETKIMDLTNSNEANVRDLTGAAEALKAHNHEVEAKLEELEKAKAQDLQKIHELKTALTNLEAGQDEKLQQAKLDYQTRLEELELALQQAGQTHDAISLERQSLADKLSSEHRQRIGELEAKLTAEEEQKKKLIIEQENALKKLSADFERKLADSLAKAKLAWDQEQSSKEILVSNDKDELERLIKNSVDQAVASNTIQMTEKLATDLATQEQQLKAQFSSEQVDLNKQWEGRLAQALSSKEQHFLKVREALEQRLLQDKTNALADKEAELKKLLQEEKSLLSQAKELEFKSEMETLRKTVENEQAKRLEEITAEHQKLLAEKLKSREAALQTKEEQHSRAIDEVRLEVTWKSSELEQLYAEKSRFESELEVKVRVIDDLKADIAKQADLAQLLQTELAKTADNHESTLQALNEEVATLKASLEKAVSTDAVAKIHQDYRKQLGDQVLENKRLKTEHQRALTKCSEETAEKYKKAVEDLDEQVSQLKITLQQRELDKQEMERSITNLKAEAELEKSAAPLTEDSSGRIAELEAAVQKFQLAEKESSMTLKQVCFEKDSLLAEYEALILEKETLQGELERLIHSTTTTAQTDEPFCYLCDGKGHTSDTCPNVKFCQNCESTEHRTEDCTVADETF